MIYMLDGFFIVKQGLATLTSSNRTMKNRTILLITLFALSLSGKAFAQPSSINKLHVEKRANNLSDKDLEAFKGKVLKKVNLLTLYLSNIANKEIDNQLRRDNITQAVNLFQDKNGNYVEVSSKSSSVVRKYSVNQYFRRLYATDAGQVKITFYEVTHLSEFRQGPDGKYYGTAHIYQLYEKYNHEGALVYTDKTVKKVNVTIDNLVKRVGDQEINVWDVKLGNIKVEETK